MKIVIVLCSIAPGLHGDLLVVALVGVGAGARLPHAHVVEGVARVVLQPRPQLHRHHCHALLQPRPLLLVTPHPQLPALVVPRPAPAHTRPAVAPIGRRKFYLK